MRILFDSKLSQFKTPFGTLVPGEQCTLHIHIPAQCQTRQVDCVFCNEDGTHAYTFPMEYRMKKGAYEIYRCVFSLPRTGLFYYYFHITTRNESFRLMKQGDQTNIECGDHWQLSCIPADFTTPDWAKGTLIYQIFPDRFRFGGKCDLSGKLQPYTVHSRWDEEVSWQPTEDGLVLNNDFYGGNFKGITEKMDYIASLGVGILYLCPISKSFSSHRYDTGDYKTPDPMLGTEADFVQMCNAAHARGMKVILDGVYSHTGSTSLYFNKDGQFPGVGAFQSPSSPYHSWYTFQHYPHHYTSWWNFDTLPTVRKMDPSFLDYIIRDEDSVVAHWLKLGADGFRLDVADELPDEFISLLRRRVREIKPDALVLGEVWEDASNKKAYGQRRRYFVDGELDSVMNYPFRTAILDFMRSRNDGQALRETVMTVLENYPPQVIPCLMNMLGTHDTARILTALVDDYDGPREERAHRHLSRNQLLTATERLRMASFLQYTLPGTPSLYYGDEAGVEGYKDPFNRRTYPWGHEDQELLTHFRWLGQMRKNSPALRLGGIEFFEAQEQRIGFTRTLRGEQVKIYVNRSRDDWEISVSGRILYGHNLRTVAPNVICVGPMGFCAVQVQEE